MRRVVFMAVFSASPAMARAHEVLPAYLELRETSPETYDILWKVPARGGLERLAVYVRLPADTQQITEPRRLFAGGAYLERWRVRRPGGLAGQPIGVDGLIAGGNDVLVHIERADGSTQTARLLPTRASFVVEAVTRPWSVASTYLVLGVDHILFGIDHLLFVLALLLLVDGARRLLTTVTAFTLAHSLTLAAATLGWAHLPQKPVEATIALSIVFVAAEIVRGREGRPGLTARRPWVVAFAFGLLHGFGFASALREVGLPQNSIPLALLFFNVGVELGQLLFIAFVLAVGLLLRQSAGRLALRMPGWTWRVPPYAMGSVASFWVIRQ